jgi:hypothetical protein
VVLLLLPWPARPARAGETARKLLARLEHALARGTPAERREAVTDVGRLSAQLDRREQLTASKLLRKALDEQDDVELRRLLIRALARMAHEHAWIPVILASQEDRQPAVRAQARQEVLSGGADELTAIGRILKTETSAAFRAELLLVLRDRRKPDAVPLLLERLEDPSRIVRAAAAEALEAISGQALGYDAARWKAWYRGWRASRPPAAGPSVAPPGPVAEPAPWVTRSLHPSFYGLTLTSKDIVFVIDISGSVGSGGVEHAKKQLVDAVSLLGTDVHVAALFFSEKVHMWKQGAMVPASPRNKEDLGKFLRGLQPGRRTDVFTPLNAGLTILAHRVAAKRAAHEVFREPVTMITVSDGQGNLAVTPPRVVASKLAQLDPALTVLHAVVLGTRDSPLLRALALRGGGHYVRAP